MRTPDFSFTFINKKNIHYNESICDLQPTYSLTTHSSCQRTPTIRWWINMWRILSTPWTRPPRTSTIHPCTCAPPKSTSRPTVAGSSLRCPAGTRWSSISRTRWRSVTGSDGVRWVSVTFLVITNDYVIVDWSRKFFSRNEKIIK